MLRMTVPYTKWLTISRGFLAPHEHISAYDLEPAMESCGYYLTIERKNDVITLRRSNK